VSKQFPEVYQGLKYSPVGINCLVAAAAAAAVQHQIRVRRVEMMLVVHRDQEDSL
jgi:hypothetical protein